METIDYISWQEIQEFIDKVVEIIMKESRVATDVATNYFSNSSYLYNMIMNTCLLTIHTGIGMNYSKEQLIELGTAAFFHDIGMFDIEDIVNQEYRLTEEQFEVLHQHPNYSIRKLNDLPEVTDNIKKGIVQVHEKIDGSGYPKGLKRNDIHKYAQIIGIANVYEAMTHTRPYKEKKLPHDAMKTIINLAGKQYDLKITRMFVKQVSIYPVGSLVKLNNGEVAKVVSANKNFPLRPVVAKLLDQSGQRLETVKSINLQKNPILNINELVSPNEVGISAEEILNVSYKEYPESVTIADWSSETCFAPIAD